jgi:hypothetical protein
MLYKAIFVLKSPNNFEFGVCCRNPLNSSVSIFFALTLNLFLMSKYSLGGSFFVTLQEVKNKTEENSKMKQAVYLIFKVSSVSITRQR